MSFATAAQTFAAQAARERRPISQARVQPFDSAGVADGSPVDVFLSAVRAEREIAENGYIIIHRASLRVLKTCRWAPAEDSEFMNVATNERFRCNTATGADSDFAAEIVCEVVKIAG